MHTVGIDLVEIEEVRDSLQTFGERYLGRVFTPRERAACGDRAARLAEVFAAKEATLKAVGRPDLGMSWQAIEIELEAGVGAARLSGPLQRLTAARGLGEVRIDTCRDRRRAAAIARVEAAR